MTQQKFRIRKRYRNFWGVSGEKENNNRKIPNGLKISRGTLNTKRKKEVEITPEKIKKIVKKMPNWKEPGPDFVQGFR